MPHARIPPSIVGSRKGRFACALVLILCLPSGGVRAELLGTHPHRNGTVQLMTGLCRRHDASGGQRARQMAGGRERRGCWLVDTTGDPVVTWSDGSELVLVGNMVRLSPRIARLLEETPEAPRGSARPSWCPQARFPHELLVCNDPELAARDLRLASLWRQYRRALSHGALTWQKSDYLRRLKACGADKACIFGEQETQMRRFRGDSPSGE